MRVFTVLLNRAIVLYNDYVNDVSDVIDELNKFLKKMHYSFVRVPLSVDRLEDDVNV